jgi:NAD(P)H-dependent flavin oxidoreductase YrpB (nitropropane dioxygenase family)
MTSTQLLQRLGVRNPVFQAPIGSVASPELAAAVAEAGGVGHLACTWRTAEEVSAAIGAVRARTGGVFGVNFVLGFPIEDQLATALDLAVPVISLFWGDGGAYVERIHAAGALAVQVVGSVSEARRAADAGFDIVVAQGHEAGGHVRGDLGTLALLPQVVDAVAPLPVLAAGGIADWRGAAAAAALGSSGVWVGTRFLAAEEADIHPVYRDAVLRSCGDDTLHSQLFDLGWPDAPLRTIRNATTEAWETAGRPPPGQRPDEGEILGHRADGTPVQRYSFSSPTRQTRGDAGAMVLYAGAAVGVVREVAPAAAIVEELAVGFRSVGQAKA